MNTKKIFLLSYDVFLFSGMKSFIPNLVLVDARVYFPEESGGLPQYKSCLIVIDNRLPVLIVNEWLQRNSFQFINIEYLVVRLNGNRCINRGYEHIDYIDAGVSADDFISGIKDKAFSLSSESQVSNGFSLPVFNLTEFEKEMLCASFKKNSLRDFCATNAITFKTMYRYRDKINTRLGFCNFNESVIFLSRNNLLDGSASGSNTTYRYGFDSSEATRLSLAIVNEEIVPYYQPIVNKDGEICGVEILARWPLGHQFAISQKEFIPFIQDSGFIDQLTSYLMANVARKLATIKRQKKDEVFVSFNISPASLNNPVFYWECLNFMESTDALPVRLLIEITEEQALNITPTIKELIRSLRNRGVLFALDDFGTGYSNLCYLNELDLDFIKIDKTFVDGIKEDNQSIPMLESIIHLAEVVGLRTMAEGVEHVYQYEWLAKNNIDFMQGYYFLPPVTFSELISYDKYAEIRNSEFVSAEDNPAENFKEGAVDTQDMPLPDRDPGLL